MSKILIALIAGMVSQAFAGEAGNGGGSYVCRDAADKIIWAEVVDLWEGKNLKELSITKGSSEKAKAQSYRAIGRLAKARFPFYTRLVAELDHVWKEFEATIARGDSGTYLTVVPDSFDLERPKNCPNNATARPKYEQTVNYLDSGEIKIDLEIFSSLQTETDRAAIAVHEAVYKLLRDTEHVRDSRRARIITAALFSASPDEDVVQIVDPAGDRPRSMLMLASGGAGIVGNGGGAYVCRNSANHVTWAEVVDLWEGKNLKDLQLPISKSERLSAREQSYAAIAKLAEVHSYMYKKVLPELDGVWREIDRSLKRGDSGTYLSIVPDSLDLERPKKCPGNTNARPKYEQVVNYLDIEDIRLDTELYRALESETDRAAIAVHEAVYKVLRDYQDEKDSRRARVITATLLADVSQAVLNTIVKHSVAGRLSPDSVRANVLAGAVIDAINMQDIARLKKAVQGSTMLFGEKITFETTQEIYNRAVYDLKGPNQLEILKELVSHRSKDLNLNGRWGFSAIESLIDHENADVLSYLLTFPEVDPQSTRAAPPLIYAILKRCKNCAEALMVNPRLDHSVEFVGMTHLQYLIREGGSLITPELIITLIETGKYDINASADTVLPIACEAVSYRLHKHTSLFEYLLQHKDFNPNVQCNDWSLIRTSMREDTSPDATTKILLHPKFNIRAADTSGTPIIHQLLDQFEHRDYEGDRLAEAEDWLIYVLTELLKREPGLDISSPISGKEWSTPVERTEGRYPRVMQFLIQAEDAQKNEFFLKRWFRKIGRWWG